jgi:hypothetical protein
MSAEDAVIERDLAKLRRDGTIVARFETAEDDRIAWVCHVDHVVTEAAERAALRAMEAACNDQPRLPFHQLLREEQRKMLRIVGPGD